YAIVVYKDGPPDFEYMERDKILTTKKRSPSVRAGMSSPWDTDEEEMWKKTAIRKLAKRLDLSPEDRRLQRLAAIDGYREAGVQKIGLGADEYALPDPGN